MFPKNRTKNSSEVTFKMFIDYDKKSQVFYHNFFFEEYKYVLKIALNPPYDGNNDMEELELRISGDSGACLKFEKFDITRYVYLLFYELAGAIKILPVTAIKTKKYLKGPKQIYLQGHFFFISLIICRVMY